MTCAAHAWDAIALGSGFGVGQVNINELGAFGDPCKFGQSVGAFPHDLPAQLTADLSPPDRPIRSSGAGGSNLSNQITTGATTTRNLRLVATQVVTGQNHLCAIGRASGDTQDQVYCWGENRTGEVGNGSRFHDTPVLAMFQ